MVVRALLDLVYRQHGDVLDSVVRHMTRSSPHLAMVLQQQYSPRRSLREDREHRARWHGDPVDHGGLSVRALQFPCTSSADRAAEQLVLERYTQHGFAQQDVAGFSGRCGGPGAEQHTAGVVGEVLHRRIRHLDHLGIGARPSSASRQRPFAIAATISAARLGAFDLAVGNMLGRATRQRVYRVSAIDMMYIHSPCSRRLRVCTF